MNISSTTLKVVYLINKRSVKVFDGVIDAEAVFFRRERKKYCFSGAGEAESHGMDASFMCSSPYERAQGPLPECEGISPDENVAALLEKRCVIGGFISFISWGKEISRKPLYFTRYALTNEEATGSLWLLTIARTALPCYNPSQFSLPARGCLSYDEGGDCATESP